MASRAIRADSVLINPLTFTPGMTPAAPLMRKLVQYDRAKVEAFVEISISLIDLMDGDPDNELNGDETDHTQSEECFVEHSFHGAGPGCSVSDPDAEHDGSEHDDGP